jgi:hypothetical protein
MQPFFMGANYLNKFTELERGRKYNYERRNQSNTNLYS